MVAQPARLRAQASGLRHSGKVHDFSSVSMVSESVVLYQSPVV
jgi:hypothetical protein